MAEEEGVIEVGLEGVAEVDLEEEIEGASEVVIEEASEGEGEEALQEEEVVLSHSKVEEKPFEYLINNDFIY